MYKYLIIISERNYDNLDWDIMDNWVKSEEDVLISLYEKTEENKISNLYIIINTIQRLDSRARKIKNELIGKGFKIKLNNKYVEMRTITNKLRETIIELISLKFIEIIENNTIYDIDRLRDIVKISITPESVYVNDKYCNLKDFPMFFIEYVYQTGCKIPQNDNFNKFYEMVIRQMTKDRIPVQLIKEYQNIIIKTLKDWYY